MSRILTISVIAIGGLSLLACSSDPSTQDDTTRDSTGNVVDGGDLGVFKLQVGDCIDVTAVTGTSEDETEVGEFDAIPCDEPHTGEVILVADDHFADVEEYSSITDLSEQGSDACITAIDEYTGTVFEESNFNVLPLVPTEASWDSLDDRGLVCIGVTLDDSLTDIVETSESIRAA